MSRKRVLLLHLATRDVDQTLDYYSDEGGVHLARRFSAALKSAYERIATHPGAGSSRYETLLDLAGLRFWQVRGFAYLIFYVELAETIEVWRVLHAERDLMAELAEGDRDTDA